MAVETIVRVAFVSCHFQAETLCSRLGVYVMLTKGRVSHPARASGIGIDGFRP